MEILVLLQNKIGLFLQYWGAFEDKLLRVSNYLSKKIIGAEEARGRNNWCRMIIFRRKKIKKGFVVVFQQKGKKKKEEVGFYSWFVKKGTKWKIVDWLLMKLMNCYSLGV